MNDPRPPRVMTREECRQAFLDHLCVMVQYWDEDRTMASSFRFKPEPPQMTQREINAAIDAVVPLAARCKAEIVVRDVQLAALRAENDRLRAENTKFVVNEMVLINERKRLRAELAETYRTVGILPRDAERQVDVGAIARDLAEAYVDLGHQTHGANLFEVVLRRHFPEGEATIRNLSTEPQTPHASQAQECPVVSLSAQVVPGETAMGGGGAEPEVPGASASREGDAMSDDIRVSRVWLDQLLADKAAKDAEISALVARVAELEGALRPFAKPKGTRGQHTAGISVGDIELAAKVLAGGERG